jgi:hypothetical protein
MLLAHLFILVERGGVAAELGGLDKVATEVGRAKMAGQAGRGRAGRPGHDRACTSQDGRAEAVTTCKLQPS